MTDPKPPNAFTIGYGGAALQIPPKRTNTKRGLSPLVRGVSPILRPNESKARKLALKSKL